MDFGDKKRIIAKNKLAIIINHDDHTVYRCIGCSAKFSEIEKLEVHLYKEHNNVYKHLCVICGTGLKRKEHLDRHLLEHREVRPFICPDCGKAFKRREHLNIHKSIHTGEKDQKCCFCSKSFYRKDHLQKHMQTHNKEITMTEHQMMQFTEEEIDIKREMTDDDDDDDDMPLLIEQAEYGKTMSEISADKPHVCNVCYKRYKRKDHLKIHSWTHRDKDKICSQCGKGFHTDTQLFVHMSTHLNSTVNVRTGKDDRPHACPICHRKFKRKAHLNAHASVHAKGFSSIWCSLCTEGFTTNEEFEQHNCTNIKQEEELNIKIEDEYSLVPQEAYNKKENTYPEPHELVEVTSSLPEEELEPVFMVHPNEHHIPVPQRVFVCKYCSKPFKRKDHYKIHLHVHTGIKSFFCPDCGKGFYRKDHLQKHLQVHNKPKPKPKKALPDLYPISLLNKQQSVLPEITITAPSNTKLRIPLQIKVPYQVVMKNEDGERQTVTVDPQTDSDS